MLFLVGESFDEFRRKIGDIKKGGTAEAVYYSEGTQVANTKDMGVDT